MATTVSFNGSSYSIPAVGNRNWGAGVTNFLIAVAGNSLSKSGGNFTLTADANFGANYGLIAKYVKSVASNIAQSGTVRLANNEGIAWRNTANNADKTLKVDADDKLAFGASAVSEAELGYLSGVTSPIQTQLAGKEASLATGTTAQYYRGDKTWQDLNTPVDARIAAASVDDLADVDTTDAVSGDVLQFDGTNWVPGTAATGSGKNYVTNPSASGDTSDWSVTDGTLTRTTTAANLPRANTTPTGFAYTSGAAGGYAYFNLNLDAADEVAANLLAQLAAVVADTGWQLQLWSNSATDFSGTYAQVKLVDGDSDGSWDLVTGTRTYTTFWTPDGNNAYQLRLVDTVGGQTIYWSDTLVGPGDAVKGAAIEPWTSYTPSNTQGFGTVTGNSLEYRRVGDSIEIRGRFTTGTVAASEAQIELPDSLTIAGSVVRRHAGTWVRDTISNTNCGPVFAAGGDTFLNFGKNDGGTTNPYDPANGNAIVASSQIFAFTTFPIPIAEWAGSGTVGLGTNRVEYAASGSTWDAAASATDTVFGPSGATISGSLTANRTKIVRFQTPIQPTDQIIVQVQRAGEWINVGDIFPYSRQSSTFYGVQVDGVAGNDTDVSVFFGQYASTSSGAYGSGGSNWGGATTAWRVVKTSAGVVTGYGQATKDVYGLVKGGKVPGVTDGLSPSAGNVGETKSVDSSGGVSPTSGQFTDGGNPGITLTPGAWIVKVHCHYVVGTTSSVTDILYGLGTASGNNGAGLTEAARSYVTERPASHTPSGNFTRSMTVFVNISTTTTYYPKFRITGTIGTGTVDNYVDAIRLF